MLFLIWKAYFSRLFLASTRPLLASSSALYLSASWTRRSISSADILPLSLVMVIFCSLPVDFSAADTFKLELTKSVVILGHSSFSFEHLNQHARLVVSIVEKVCDFLAGTLVFLLIRVVMTPPAVSIPRES